MMMHCNVSPIMCSFGFPGILLPQRLAPLTGGFLASWSSSIFLLFWASGSKGNKPCIVFVRAVARLLWLLLGQRTRRVQR